MKIDFTQLIKNSGEKLTKVQLAKEMVAEGLFKNLHSAVNMIQYHNSGKAKSCDWKLIKYLCMRFNKEGADIIKWDE